MRIYITRADRSSKVHVTCEKEYGKNKKTLILYYPINNKNINDNYVHTEWHQGWLVQELQVTSAWHPHWATLPSGIWQHVGKQTYKQSGPLGPGA